MHKAQGSALGRAWLLSAQGPALPARAAGVPLFPAGVNSRTAAPEEKKPQLIIQREKEPAPTFCLAVGGECPGEQRRPLRRGQGGDTAVTPLAPAFSPFPIPRRFFCCGSHLQQRFGGRGPSCPLQAVPPRSPLMARPGLRAPGPTRGCGIGGEGSWMVPRRAQSIVPWCCVPWCCVPWCVPTGQLGQVSPLQWPRQLILPRNSTPTT